MPNNVVKDEIIVTLHTVRPVLINSGVLASGIEEDGYFDNILDFNKLITASIE